MEQLLVFVRFFRFLQDLIVKRLQIALQAPSTAKWNLMVSTP